MQVKYHNKFNSNILNQKNSLSILFFVTIILNISFGVEGTVYVPVEVIDDFTEGFVYLPCTAYQGMASSDYN